MRAKTICVLLICISCQQAVAQTCDEIRHANHDQVFISLKTEAEGANGIVELRELAAHWVGEGDARRDKALSCINSCVSKGDLKERDAFWNISYSYRELADFFRSLVSDSGAELNEAQFRGEVIDRIEMARENLNFDFEREDGAQEECSH